jgi:pyrroloquinoline quinone (PQQ) biosynthesis protein C
MPPAPPSSVQSLVEELVRHPVNDNRFFRAFAAAPLTQAQLRTFLRQYQYFCKHFVKALEGLLYATPLDEVAMRTRLIQTLHSETGAGRSDRAHITLLNRFASAVGLSEEELARTIPLPEVGDYLALLHRLFTQCGHLVALGSEAAVEITAGSEFRYFFPGLRNHYTFSTEDIEFFYLHLREEACHADWLREAVERTVRTPQDLELVAAGARETAEGWLRFWDAIHQAVFRDRPVAAG